MVSGFTFIRNGIRFDYPFRESITSLLPLVDELVIAVGDSDDGTREAVLGLNSPKIRVIDTQWDENLRTGGAILAQQTDIALKEIDGDWGIYLQGDEVLHEDDTDLIENALAHYSQDPDIEGLLFDYIHFYGSYSTVGDSRKWYRREIRAIRNGIGVRSWGDAQGFRRDGKKLRVAHVPARVYHYGWVKPPEVQRQKLTSFHRLWHPDSWVENRIASPDSFEYADGGRLSAFDGSHPWVMMDRIRKSDWHFDPKRSQERIGLKDKLLTAVEDMTGWRPGEYRNYILEDTFERSR